MRALLHRRRRGAALPPEERDDDDDDIGDSRVGRRRPPSQSPRWPTSAARCSARSSIALSIAPTDEVPMIACGPSPAWLLAIVAVIAAHVLRASCSWPASATRRPGTNRRGSPAPHHRDGGVVPGVASSSRPRLLWLFQRGHRPDRATSSTAPSCSGSPQASAGRRGGWPYAHRRAPPRTPPNGWPSSGRASLLGAPRVADRGPAARFAGRPRPRGPRDGTSRLVGDLHHVEVTVRNDGDKTAEAVQVVAELLIDGEATERRSGDRLPGRRRGGRPRVRVRRTTPSDGELTVAVSGFSVPDGRWRHRRTTGSTAPGMSLRGRH